jgi:uncharacterized phage protein gp47/JayE
MADLPNRSVLFQVGRRYLLASPNTRINPRMVDVPGSDVNLITGLASIMGEAVVAEQAGCMSGLFVETASGPALDRVVYDRYKLTRFPAAPATVTLTLTRPTAAFGAFSWSAGSRVQTVGGTQFATDTDVVFSGAQLTTTVNATAMIAGVDGNVPAATLTQFTDAPADTTLTCSNVDTGVVGTSTFIPGGAAGGVEAEEDPDFRARAFGFFPTLRRGVLGAIEYAALQITGVAVAKAIEILPPESSGYVQLIIADSAGGYSASMLRKVRDKLLEYRALGIYVLVTGGIVVNVPVTWKLAYTTGVDQSRVQQDVRAVTVAVAQFLSPGQTLLSGGRAVPGAIINDTSLVTPLGDTLPVDNAHLIRIDPNTITFT